MLYSLIILVETRYTSKLLQGEMCQSSIDKVDLTDHEKSCLGFQHTCLLYYNSCWNVLEIPQLLSCSCGKNVVLVLQAFLVKTQYGMSGDFNETTPYTVFGS